MKKSVTTHEESSALTREQQRLLDLTIREHKEGRSKSYSWAEARDTIQKRSDLQAKTKGASTKRHK
jgi:hypothetical protein